MLVANASGFRLKAGIAVGFVKATYADENGGQSPTVTPAKAGVQNLTNQWRSLCLEFLDSRLRGNDELGIFMGMTGSGYLLALWSSRLMTLPLIPIVTSVRLLNPSAH